MLLTKRKFCHFDAANLVGTLSFSQPKSDAIPN